MIIDGCRFCNIEETDNSHSRWQSFQFRFNSSAEIVCNQLNFNRKILVFSRILAEFFSTRDNSDNPNIRRIFPSHPHFFGLQIGGLCTGQGTTTFWKFWVRSASWGKIGAWKSPAKPEFFCRQNEMTFRQLPNGRFSPSWLRHVNPCSLKMYRKGIFQKKIYSLNTLVRHAICHILLRPPTYVDCIKTKDQLIMVPPLTNTTGSM